MKRVDLKLALNDLENDISGINGYISTIKKEKRDGMETLHQDKLPEILSYFNEKYKETDLNSLEGLEGFSETIKGWVKDIKLKLTESSRKKPKFQRNKYNMYEVFGDYTKDKWLNEQTFREGKVKVNGLPKAISGDSLSSIEQAAKSFYDKINKEYNILLKDSQKRLQIALPIFKKVAKASNAFVAKGIIEENLKNIPEVLKTSFEYKREKDTADLPALTKAEIKSAVSFLKDFLADLGTFEHLAEEIIDRALDWDDILDYEDTWDDKNLSLGKPIIMAVEWESSSQEPNKLIADAANLTEDVCIFFENWILASIK